MRSNGPAAQQHHKLAVRHLGLQGGGGGEGREGREGERRERGEGGEGDKGDYIDYFIWLVFTFPHLVIYASPTQSPLPH